MIQAQLQIEFLNYWHAGTGKSGGRNVDAVTEKDGNQLPFISGRHLKGLLRDATHRAENWGWFKNTPLPEGPAPTLEQLLFGSTNQVEKRTETAAGMLIMDDATLPKPEAAFLAHRDKHAIRDALYENLFSTAINDAGTAKDGSLRGMEVCVPLMLEATVALMASALEDDLRAQQERWLEAENWAWLCSCLTLIDSLGASRTRGLGEAQLTLANA